MKIDIISCILASLSFFLSSGYHIKSRNVVQKYNSVLLKCASSSFLERQQRPRAVGLPRRRMELPFAVLLMRSSYSIADDLDFVPMDEFQRSFFLYRQSEWEIYKDQHPRVMQGDLADPSYFDFISFAQYVVLADKMKNGKLDFIEKVRFRRVMITFFQVSAKFFMMIAGRS